MGSYTGNSSDYQPGIRAEQTAMGSATKTDDLVIATLTTTSNAAVGGKLSVAGAFGMNGQTAVGKSAAYTLTYNTATRTVAVATVAAVATTAATSTTPFGYSQAQADAIPVAINALAADVLALKKVIVALVVDNQAVGIAG